ncbi:hypothetical protein [Streptomyces sp. NPDC127072]|uniref:hypothetical protein n=1 Tax=Streptomyces sp. NPDC127072 TaxID=3347129 RepID=UPI00365127DB
MAGSGSRTVVAAVLLCLGAAVLSACTGSGVPDVRTSAAAATGSAFRELTQSQRAVLARAENLLVRDCMREQGFSFWVTEELPATVGTKFPYVVDDGAWAAENGYGGSIEKRRDALAAENPNQRYFKGLSAVRRSAAVSALNGAEPEGLEADVPGMGRVRHSDEGCEAEAQRSLYTDLPRWYRARKVTEALEQQVRSAVVGDARFTRAVTRWATCMRAAGHAYSTPPESRRAFARGPDARPADEVETAVAEARCAVSSGLSSGIRTLERVHRDEVNSRYAVEVRDRSELEHLALSRAHRIVRRG